MRGTIGSVLLTLAAGCGLLLDPEPPSNAPGADGGIADDAGGDARLRVDSAATDALVVQPDDAGLDASDSRCGVRLDVNTVAFYDFDADPADRVLDIGPSLVHGNRIGDVATVPGFCGSAITFGPSSPPSHVEITKGEEFRLAEGSVELRVYPPSPIAIGALLSRDENGSNSGGHLGAWVADTGHVVVRLQQSITEGGAHTWLCSNAPLPPDTWSHVGVNWGGDQRVELWVNGEFATNTARNTHSVNLTGDGPSFAQCSSTGFLTVGLEQNSLPMILGANASRLPTNREPSQLLDSFVGGRIDEVHFRNTRTDFSRR